jgi:hypothetical protein
MLLFQEVFLRLIEKMKKYIKPIVYLEYCQLGGTLCSSEQPSAAPPATDTRPGKAAPERRPF